MWPIASIRKHRTKHNPVAGFRLRNTTPASKHRSLDHRGGSWGSALGLAYTETHPGRCLGTILFGVIIERKTDLWWWWEGVRFVYPEVWETFRDTLPQHKQSNMRENYVRRVLDPDPKVHGPAAASWIKYEIQTLDVWPDRQSIDSVAPTPQTIGAARIFAHYDRHNFFLEEEQLFKDAHRLRNVPGILLNGRFDMCTPPRTCYELHKLWPGSEIEIILAAGHRWGDEHLGHAVVRAISRMGDLVERQAASAV